MDKFIFARRLLYYSLLISILGIFVNNCTVGEPQSAVFFCVYAPESCPVLGVAELAGWKYRQSITFQNTTRGQSLVDFPILVKLNSSRFSYDKAASDGADLRFYDPDTDSILKHEIEKWNPSGESFIWVRVPLINANSDTDLIYLVYGNQTAESSEDSTGLWSNFTGVWHLNDSPVDGGTQKDSGPNAVNGTYHDQGGNADTDVSGQIGGANYFDGYGGSTDYVSVGPNSNLDLSGGVYTQEVWIKPEDSGDAGSYGIMASEGEGDLTQAYPGIRIYLQSRLRFVRGDDTTDQSLWVGIDNTVTLNQWNYLSVTCDGTDWIAYVNGIEVERSGCGAVTNQDRFYIGTSDPAGDFYGGIIDEVRISKTAHSADWLSAQYASMNDTFITYGAMEDNL